MQVNTIKMLQLDYMFIFLFKFFIKFQGIDIWALSLISVCRIYSSILYNWIEAIFIVSARDTTNAEVLLSNEILVHIVLEQVVPQFSCRQVYSQLLILVTPEVDSGVTE